MLNMYPAHPCNCEENHPRAHPYINDTGSAMIVEYHVEVRSEGTIHTQRRITVGSHGAYRMIQCGYIKICGRILYTRYDTALTPSFDTRRFSPLTMASCSCCAM